MMRTSYDPEADAFYARFAPDGTEIAETKEVAPGVMVDLDASGQLVGVEVLSVAARGSGAYGGSSVLSAAQ
jgi:uncharacterized protein YuzE